MFNRFLEEGHADNAELEKMIFEQDGEFKTIYSAVWTLITWHVFLDVFLSKDAYVYPSKNIYIVR